MAVDAETRTWRNSRCAPSGRAAACAARIIASSRSPPPIKTRMDCMHSHPSMQGHAYSAVASEVSIVPVVGMGQEQVGRCRYPELWRSWDTHAEPEWLRAHVGRPGRRTCRPSPTFGKGEKFSE